MANVQYTVKIAEAGDRAQLTVKVAEAGDRPQLTLRVAEAGDRPQMTVRIADAGHIPQYTAVVLGYSPGGDDDCDGQHLDLSCDENSGHAGGTV